MLCCVLPTADSNEEDEQEGGDDDEDDGDDDGAESVPSEADHLCPGFTVGADMDLVVGRQLGLIRLSWGRISL